jgi:hypothetical protein
MASEGGHPVRWRMKDGRAQFWVVQRDGAVVASSKLLLLANALGVLDAMNDTTDYILLGRAAALTGYSQTALRRAVKLGELVAQPGVRGSHSISLSRSAVEKWAAERRKKGGQYLPRRVRRRRSGEIPTQKWAGANGNTPTRARAAAPHGDRLARYLATLEGTPLHMTPEQFTARVVNDALDKLGAK